MVAFGTLAILIVATLASLFMAWTIGAGSSGSTPFAPAVGARAISVMRAGFLVGILGLLGAILQGANVADAVGTGLVGGLTLSPTAATVLLLLAAGLVAVGIFTGYPIATAFTVTGAVVGVGLGLGGSPVWPKYAEIGTLWLLVPFVGGGIAYVTARVLRHESIPERYTIPALGAIIGLIVANIPFTLLGSGSSGASIAAAATAELPLPSAIGQALVSLLVAVAAAGALVWDLDSSVEGAERHFARARRSGGVFGRRESGRTGRRTAARGGQRDRASDHDIAVRTARLRRDRPARGFLDGCAADDQGDRPGLLLARPAAVDRGTYSVVCHRPDRRRLRHSRLVQRDHRQRGRRQRLCGRRGRRQHAQDGEHGARVDRLARAGTRARLRTDNRHSTVLIDRSPGQPDSRANTPFWGGDGWFGTTALAVFLTDADPERPGLCCRSPRNPYGVS